MVAYHFVPLSLRGKGRSDVRSLDLSQRTVDDADVSYVAPEPIPSFTSHAPADPEAEAEARSYVDDLFLEIEEEIRIEDERREWERLEAERREQERIEAERLERERIEAERREWERLEAERLEREEAERLEAERIAREKAEEERREREEAERLEREREEAARAEAERIERERAEAERLERERAEAELREQVKAAAGASHMGPVDLEMFAALSEEPKGGAHFGAKTAEPTGPEEKAAEEALEDEDVEEISDESSEVETADMSEAAEDAESGEQDESGSVVEVAEDAITVAAEVADEQDEAASAAEGQTVERESDEPEAGERSQDVDDEAFEGDSDASDEQRAASDVLTDDLEPQEVDDVAEDELTDAEGVPTAETTEETAGVEDVQSGSADYFEDLDEVDVQAIEDVVGSADTSSAVAGEAPDDAFNTMDLPDDAFAPEPEVEVIYDEDEIQGAVEEAAARGEDEDVELEATLVLDRVADAVKKLRVEGDGVSNYAQRQQTTSDSEIHTEYLAGANDQERIEVSSTIMEAQAQSSANLKDKGGFFARIGAFVVRALRLDDH